MIFIKPIPRLEQEEEDADDEGLDLFSFFSNLAFARLIDSC